MACIFVLLWFRRFVWLCFPWDFKVTIRVYGHNRLEINVTYRQVGFHVKIMVPSKILPTGGSDYHEMLLFAISSNWVIGLGFTQLGIKRTSQNRVQIFMACSCNDEIIDWQNSKRCLLISNLRVLAIFMRTNTQSPPTWSEVLKCHEFGRSV